MLVTKEDVNTLKNDWLTDNVRLIRCFWRIYTDEFLPRSSHSGKSMLTLLLSNIPSHSQIPRTRTPLHLPKHPHRPPPTLHVVHAPPNPRPPNYRHRTPQPKKRFPHLPPNNRLPKPFNPRRRLPLVPPPRLHRRRRS